MSVAAAHETDGVSPIHWTLIKRELVVEVDGVPTRVSTLKAGLSRLAYARAMDRAKSELPYGRGWTYEWLLKCSTCGRRLGVKAAMTEMSSCLADADCSGCGGKASRTPLPMSEIFAMSRRAPCVDADWAAIKLTLWRAKKHYTASDGNDDAADDAEEDEEEDDASYSPSGSQEGDYEIEPYSDDG